MFWCVHGFCLFSMNCNLLHRFLVKSMRAVRKDNKSVANFLHYFLDNVIMGTLQMTKFEIN